MFTPDHLHQITGEIVGPTMAQAAVEHNKLPLSGRFRHAVRRLSGMVASEVDDRLGHDWVKVAPEQTQNNIDVPPVRW